MRYLFDSRALVAFFNDKDKAEGFISSITLTELYYLYIRSACKDVAEKRIEQIRFSNLKVVVINDAVALKAGEYKVGVIPIADALLVASAYYVNANVVTDDKYFEVMDVEIVKFRDGQ